MNQCLIDNTPINIIVNLNNFDKAVNGHLCLRFIHNDQIVYYLSFVDIIFNQEKEFIMKINDR